MVTYVVTGYLGADHLSRIPATVHDDPFCFGAANLMDAWLVARAMVRRLRLNGRVAIYRKYPGLKGAGELLASAVVVLMEQRDWITSGLDLIASVPEDLVSAEEEALAWVTAEVPV
jgi:hypothetical protein